MVIEFSLGNYRSFNSIQTLNFRATTLVSEIKDVDSNNIIEYNGFKILKAIGIYGANGSGKSNFLNGLLLMKRIIISSLDAESPKEFVDPFKLSSKESKEGGFFQLVFMLDRRKYRYGFTLSSIGQITSEWLFGLAEKNETYYFKRHGREVLVNPDRFEEGNNLPLDKLRDDALFLSFCDSYNGQTSRGIRKFFHSYLSFDSSSRRSILSNRFNNHFTDDLILGGKKDIVINWMREAGISVNDIQIIKHEELRARNIVYLVKYKYDENGIIIGNYPMDLGLQESDGTRKFYSYIGRFNHIFKNGGLFSSDEIDANFHPSLLRKLIQLFNNPLVNTGGAQLLFTSHDTNLMDPDLMRRDQFYFTEKTSQEDTKLYSLADLKGIRNNADFARQYLSGFYGAIPYLSNYLENLAEGN